MRQVLVLTAAIVFVVLASVGYSEAINITCPTINTTSCSGTLTYTYPGGSPLDATHATLELHITNTGAGNFTTIGIEIPDTPDGSITAVSLLAGSEAGWTLCNPCGLPGFDVHAEDGTSVTPGNTLDLYFNLTGPALALAALSDSVIANNANATASCGANGAAWGCLHVQSVPALQGSSEKLPMRSATTSVPEPGLLLVLGSGLGGLIAWTTSKRS